MAAGTSALTGTARAPGATAATVRLRKGQLRGGGGGGGSGSLAAPRIRRPRQNENVSGAGGGRVAVPTWTACHRCVQQRLLSFSEGKGNGKRKGQGGSGGGGGSDLLAAVSTRCRTLETAAAMEPGPGGEGDGDGDGFVRNAAGKAGSNGVEEGVQDGPWVQLALAIINFYRTAGSRTLLSFQLSRCPSHYPT